MSLEIKEVGQFTVVGVKCVGKSPAELGQMWGEFIPRMGEIANRVGGHFYGLIYTDESLPKGTFPYIAGVEVSAAASVPEGMVSYTVPALRYAVYTHKGPAVGISKAWADGWNEFCEAGHECGGVNFELYPPDYDDSENSITELYFATK
jgi:AraC family transcriptional regulator